MDPKKAKLAALKNIKAGLGSLLDEEDRGIGARGMRHGPHRMDFAKKEDELWAAARGDDAEKAKDAIRLLATKYSDLGKMVKSFGGEDRAYEALQDKSRPMVIADESADGGVGDMKVLKSEPKPVDTSKLSQEAKKNLEMMQRMTKGVEDTVRDFKNDAMKGAENAQEDGAKVRVKMRDSMRKTVGDIESILGKDPKFLTDDEVRKIREFMKMQGNPDGGSK